MKWLVMAALLATGVWFFGRGPVTTATPTARQVSSSGRSENGAVGKAFADKMFGLAQVDASIVTSAGAKMRAACNRNKYGLSEEACQDKIDEREDFCADRIAQRYPGAISDTDKMLQVVKAYAKCIFEEG